MKNMLTKYKLFKVPYREKDNNNYLENDNFCCGNKKSSKGDGITDNEDPELNQFYYHSDHLGSSSYITNLKGSIVQHIEYVPFGEVFIEERNNKWNTPYLFNGKELDEETGLYYYGARYYSGKTSLWLSVDPLAEKYPGVSPYCYTLNNPVKFIDPDGREIQVPPNRVSINRSNRTPPSAGTIRYERYSPKRTKNKIEQSFFDKSVPHTAGQQMTKGNITGKNLEESINFFGAIVEHIKEKSNISGAEGYTTKENETIRITFQDEHMQDKFNEMQSSYEFKLKQKIDNVKKPIYPGSNASLEKMQKYNLENKAYNLTIAVIKQNMGLSPKKKVLKYMNDAAERGQINKEVNIRSKSIIYETPNH